MRTAAVRRAMRPPLSRAAACRFTLPASASMCPGWLVNILKLPCQAEAKYNEALAVKGEHVDALQYLGSLEMERAKLAAGINVGTRCVEFSIGARLVGAVTPGHVAVCAAPLLAGAGCCRPMPDTVVQSFGCGLPTDWL